MTTKVGPRRKDNQRGQGESEADSINCEGELLKNIADDETDDSVCDDQHLKDAFGEVLTFVVHVMRNLLQEIHIHV